MMNKQLIAFTRGKVYVSNENPVEWSEERKARLITLTKELENVGYILSPKAILLLSDQDMKEIHDTVIPLAAKDLYPAGNWKPLYPGFPEQVISMSEKELFEKQRKLYDTLDYDKFLEENPWYPEEEKKRIASATGGKEKELGVLTEKDVLDIFKSILASGNSIADTTKGELIWLLSEYPEYKLPEDIPFKETMCIVMSMRPEYRPKTINDVLRFGLYTMGADPALVHVPKEIKETSWRNAKMVKNPAWRNLLSLSHANRRNIMAAIEDVVTKKGLEAVIPDAKRFYGHWLLLSERLHPGEYFKKYPKAAEFFLILKDNKSRQSYKTWYGILQDKYNKAEDIVEIAKFIAKRPGELVRRFDSLLRRASLVGKEYEVFEVFLDTDGMKNKTLTELLAYYDKRNSGAPRLVSLKGSRSRKALTPLQPLSQHMIETIRDFIERKILINIDKAITEKDLVGQTVYLDPTLKSMPVPIGMRENIGVVPAGTRIPIGDKNYIRMFIHWIQKDRNEDLDLHGILYKDDTTWTNIGFNSGFKTGSGSACHSGDVLNRPGDCSEFIDLNIERLADEGWKYVVMDVCNFKGRGFNTLDNWLGYITYNSVPAGAADINRSRLWIPPKDVDFSKKIEVSDKSIAAWIFDIEKKEAIFIGAGMENMPVNRGRENLDLIKFFSAPMTFTSYSVLEQYYTSRGATIISETTEPDATTEEAPAVPDIVINANDILHDYTKILEILG